MSFISRRPTDSLRRRERTTFLRDRMRAGSASRPAAR
jgi:hypothetical protein